MISARVRRPVEPYPDDFSTWTDFYKAVAEYHEKLAADNLTSPRWVALEILRLLVKRLSVMGYFGRESSNAAELKRSKFLRYAELKIKIPLPRQVRGNPILRGQALVEGWFPQWNSAAKHYEYLYPQCPIDWGDYKKAVKKKRSEEELRENYWGPIAAAFAAELLRYRQKKEEAA